MNRIEKIKQYKNYVEKKEQNLLNDKENEKKQVEQKIKELNPRINELLGTANNCVENKLDIEPFLKNYAHKNSIEFLDISKHHGVKLFERDRIGHYKALHINYSIIDSYFNGKQCVKLYDYKYKDYPDLIDERELEGLKLFLTDFEKLEKDFYEYVDAKLEEMDLDEGQEK